MESVPREPLPNRPADAQVGPQPESSPSVSAPQSLVVPPAKASTDQHAARTTAERQSSVEPSVAPEPSVLPGGTSTTTVPAAAPADQATPEGGAPHVAAISGGRDWAQPDSLACLPVVVSAATYVFFAMGLLRSESVMFDGFMQMLKVDRTTASLPLTVAVIMSQLGGPVYGMLGLWFSERALLIVGALLCSLPVMACGLTKSVALIIFLYGVLTGMGVACEEVVPFTVVARHFVRYKGAALSVLFVITSLSGSLSPLVAQALRRAFGFRTALFFIGALELNMLLGCVFVNRVAPHSERSAVQHGRSDDNTVAQTPAITPPPGSGRPEMRVAPLAQSVPEEHVEPVASARPVPSVHRPPEAGSEWTKFARGLRSLASAEFLLVAASRAVSVLVIATFLLTALDFGKDSGLSDDEAVVLVSTYSAGDLLARIATGIVLDFKLLSGGCLMVCAFTSDAVALLLMSLVKKHWTLLAGCFVSGLSGGSRIIASTIIVAGLFHDNVLQLSLGVTNFAAGVVVLTRTPLVGITRDATGSYIPLYSAYAVLNIAFAVMWAASLCCQRFRRRRGTEDGGAVAGADHQATPS